MSARANAPTIANSTVVIPRCDFTFTSCSGNGAHGSGDHHVEIEAERSALTEVGQYGTDHRLVGIGRGYADIASPGILHGDVADLILRQPRCPRAADVAEDCEILCPRNCRVAELHDASRAIDRVRGDEADRIADRVAERRIVDERPTYLRAGKQHQ